MSLKVFFPFTCCRFKNKQLVASRHWRSISQGPLGGWVIDSKPIGCYHIWGRKNPSFLAANLQYSSRCQDFDSYYHIKHVQKKTSGNISNCIFPHGWSHSPTLLSQKDTQHGAMAYHHVRIIVLLQIVGQIWRRTQI